MVRQYAQRQQRQRSVQQYQQGSNCLVLQQQESSELLQFYSLLLRVQRRLAFQARTAPSKNRDDQNSLINQHNKKGLQSRKPFELITKEIYNFLNMSIICVLICLVITFQIWILYCFATF